METRSYPRQGHYHLAHVALPRDAHEDGAGLWGILTGPDCAAAVEMLQGEAEAVGESRGDPGPVQGLAVEGVERRGEWELLLLRFPEPLAPTEAFLAALARRSSAPAEVGYFVLERSSQGEGYVAEWRRGGRIRMQPLPAGDRRQGFIDQLFEELAGRGQPAFPGLGDAAAAPPAGGRASGPAHPGKASGGRVGLILGLLLAFVVIGGVAAAVMMRAPEPPAPPPTPVAAPVATPGTPAAVAEAEAAAEAAAAAGTAAPTPPPVPTVPGIPTTPGVPAVPTLPPPAGAFDAVQMSKQLQVSALLGQAAQAMGAQDHVRAGILFDQVLRLDPGNALAKSARQMLQAQRELGRGRKKKPR